jgi:hypothetical protein
MKLCPDHIKDVVLDASARFQQEADEYHHYFQLECKCGGDIFTLFESNHRSVRAECASCRELVLIYDLELYPAASKLTGAEHFQLMSVSRSPSRVFLSFEYGELDEGEVFDPNDITWFQIFIEASDGELVKVFDDETA